MQIVLVSSVARVIAATGQIAQPGVPCDVPDAVAESLLMQPDVWQPAPVRPARKAATTEE